MSMPPLAPSETRRLFLEASARLTQALGDWMSAECAHPRAQADRLLQDRDAPPERTLSLPPPDLAPAEWDDNGWLKFAFLTPLAMAYDRSGDERLAQCARRYWDVFLQAQPAEGPDWRPTPGEGDTTYPKRVGSLSNWGWLGALPIFLRSPLFDDAFFERAIAAARRHLIYLEHHVYPGRNIRLLHGKVLLVGGLCLPFLAEAESWRAQGVAIVNDGVARQILSDGADMEGSPEYHLDVLMMLVALDRIARAYPELPLRLPSHTLAAMFDYALSAARPDGALTPLNDCYYLPSRTLAHGCDYWLPERREFLRRADLPDRPPPLCRHYPDVGQIFLRDQWGPDALYLTFDATLRRGWHWHPSRNAIQLYAYRRALLADPGYYFKHLGYGDKTAHHSTLNIEGLDQSHALAWARHRQAPGYDLVEGLYNGGYWPTADNRHGAGIFGEHYRALLWIRERCIVVLDMLSTMPEPDAEWRVESVWQFGEGASRLDVTDRTACTTHPAGNLLMLFPLTASGTRLEVHTGERDPMRGWVAYGSVPAPQLRLHARMREPWKVHLATVLVPFPGAEPPAIKANALAPGAEFGDRTAGRLDLQWPDGSSDLLVWTGRLEEAIGRQHGLETNASLAHLTFDRAGRIVHGLVVDGDGLLCDAAGAGDFSARVVSLK